MLVIPNTTISSCNLGWGSEAPPTHIIKSSKEDAYIKFKDIWNLYKGSEEHDKSMKMKTFKSLLKNWECHFQQDRQ